MPHASPVLNGHEGLLLPGERSGADSPSLLLAQKQPEAIQHEQETAAQPLAPPAPTWQEHESSGEQPRSAEPIGSSTSNGQESSTPPVLVAEQLAPPRAEPVTEVPHASPVPTGHEDTEWPRDWLETDFSAALPIAQTEPEVIQHEQAESRALLAPIWQEHEASHEQPRAEEAHVPPVLIAEQLAIPFAETVT